MTKPRILEEFDKINEQLNEKAKQVDLISAQQNLKAEFDYLKTDNSKTIFIKRQSTDRYEIFIQHKDLIYQGYRMTRESFAFDGSVSAHANGRPFVYDCCLKWEASNQKTAGQTTVNLVGTWTDGLSRKVSSITNDYVEYKFYGSKIRADLYKSTNTGIARITIDGRDDLCDAITLTGGQALIDTYSTSAGAYQVTVANNLSEGWHTVRITVTGTKNASSTDYRVYFEKYVYWQSIYSEYEYVDTLSLTLISDGQFKYPSTVDEMAISVEGVWSGSWHGNSRPSVAGVHKIIIDGVETVLNVGDIKYCKQVAFEQDIVHYTGSGDFATNKLKHIFNHEGLNIRNDFTLTRQVTISEFYPIMGEAFGDCIKVSNSLNKIVLQKNNTETNLGYAPYSALVAQDLYNSLYLIQPLDIVNSKINNPSSNHFFVDKSQGYAKFYYRAEKGLKDIGYNVKTSTLYSFAHCKNPSYFI